MHPSEIGAAIGFGMDGAESLRKMFGDHREEKDVQSDVLHETFISNTAGWVNLLLLSSSGPIKVPAGGCAAGLQSIEIACDTILSGKAKVMITGGYDDTNGGGIYEFAVMKATSHSGKEFTMGCEPSEMSRRATTTRSGSMEFMSIGIHVITSAKTALELGAPIRGIIVFTSISTNEAGRSIPAPGRGSLTVTR